MKRLIITLIIALISIQLAIGQDDAPTEPISATLTFSSLNLPSGPVTGYNLTMEGDATLSVLGVGSKAVYFIVGAQPAFYRKTTENNIQSFDVPFDADANLRITAMTEDASEVVINRLPYQFAYGDSVDFGLDIAFEGSMYGLIFGRALSNGAIKVNNVAGKRLFLYNDADGGFTLLKDDNALQSFDVSSNNLDFRAPSALAGGEDEAVAEERRRERAGARAELESADVCTDVDGDAGNEQYSMPSYGYEDTGLVLSDFCASDVRVGRKVLNEVKCNAEGNIYLEEHQCSGVCSNGACTAVAHEGVAFCYDTDFQGRGIGLENSAQVLARSYATKGVNIGFYAAAGDISYGLWTDSCASEKKLVEYACKLDRTRFSTVTCGSGCSEGKCASPPYCTDTDGGVNEKAQGAVTVIKAKGVGAGLEMTASVDDCINQRSVREYFCNDDASAGLIVKECQFGCVQGRCLKEGEVVELPKSCTSKDNCNFSQGCLKEAGAADGVCGKCTKSADCGSGWQCASGRCRPAIGRCVNDINCKLGKYCEKGPVGQLGYCSPENIRTLEGVRLALERRWNRIGVYDKIISSAESLHGLALPVRKANGQSCLVNSQCTSKYCNPETSKCEAAGATPRAGVNDLRNTLAVRNVPAPPRPGPIIPRP